MLPAPGKKLYRPGSIVQALPVPRSGLLGEVYLLKRNAQGPKPEA